jgi:hypothetical protein
MERTGICKELANFPPVAFLVVVVDFSAFFVPGLLVGSVTKRLVLRETAHANPDRGFLRLNLERSLGGFEDLAHNLMVKIEYEQDVEPQVRIWGETYRRIGVYFGDRTLVLRLY